MGKTLSLEAKVGQLLMFGFAGPTVSPHIREFIVKHNLGGVIHFARNVENQHTRAAQSRVPTLAKQSPSGMGLDCC